MKDNISGIDGMATELYRLVTHKKTLLCINHHARAFERIHRDLKICTEIFILQGLKVI
jgi:hypothetical protein